MMDWRVATRRLSALAMVVYLSGIPWFATHNFVVISATNTHDAVGFIVFWCFLPVELLALGLVSFIVGGILFNFFGWALGKPKEETHDEKVARLERGIAELDKEISGTELAK